MTNGQATTTTLENASVRLMQQAFVRSAESFSQFLGKKVSFDSIDKMGDDSMLSLLQLGEPLSLISSDMIGDLRGTCYLIFSKEDAGEICKYQLGEMYKKDDELQDALLMELANILTASFVTVLANVLNIKTHAHVPKLKKIDKLEMFSLLKTDEIYLSLSQKFKIQYSIDDIKIQPVFTWAFDANINTYIAQWVEKEMIG